MQKNKNGIPVQQASTPRKRVKPQFKLEQTTVEKITVDGYKSIIIPDFAPVKAILGKYGWEQREVVS